MKQKFLFSKAMKVVVYEHCASGLARLPGTRRRFRNHVPSLSLCINQSVINLGSIDFI